MTDTMTDQLKLYESFGTVKPEWLDHNGHMNVAYYVLAFDFITDAVYDQWGLGDDYQEQGYSVFTLGMNVDYLQELYENDPLRITTQLLAWDHKRVHYFHHMYHAKKGFLAATNECLGINVNLESRRSEPFPEPIQAILAEIYEAHQHLPLPAGAGRQLGIRQK